MKSGIAASALLTGLSSLASPVTAHGRPAAVGRAMICDVEMDQHFAAQMVPVSDPTPKSKDDRGTVVHATSGGTETMDYVCSTVDVREQNLTIDDVRKGRGLAYDYLVGPNNRNAAPDEVFLTIRTDESVYVAYQTANEHRPVGKWFTRNVSAELNGKGRGWHAIEVDSSAIDTEKNLANTTNGMIIDAILSLRERESFDSVVAQFGREAELLAVTIGKGSTTRETVIDVYFDNLVVGEKSYHVPGVVTLGTEFFNINESTSAFNVELTFPEMVSLLGPEDVDVTSSVLSAFVPIAPPVPGTKGSLPDRALAAEPAEEGGTGRTSGDSLRVDFDRDLIVQKIGSGRKTVLVSGEFATRYPASFVAVGDLELEG